MTDETEVLIPSDPEVEEADRALMGAIGSLIPEERHARFIQMLAELEEAEQKGKGQIQK